MSDAEFLTAFEEGSIEQFRHIDHIRMAWIYLGAHDAGSAVESITSGIRIFAEKKNAKSLYHETITLFWIYVVADARKRTIAGTFEDFIAVNPNLTRKEYLFEFYSRELLMSEAARRTWISPDLRCIDVRRPLVATPQRR